MSFVVFCRCLLQSHHLLYTGRIFLCRTFYKKRCVGVRVTEPCRKNVQNAKLAEDGFYRVELPSSLYNCSLAAKINTTEFYYSVIPKSMKDLYVSLGMAKYERPNVMHGLENRQILKNMLCVRYQSDKKGSRSMRMLCRSVILMIRSCTKRIMTALHRLSGGNTAGVCRFR